MESLQTCCWRRTTGLCPVPILLCPALAQLLRGGYSVSPCLVLPCPAQPLQCCGLIPLPLRVLPCPALIYLLCSAMLCLLCCVCHLTCHVHPALPCRVWPCPALSGPSLPCPAAPCPASPCLSTLLCPAICKMTCTALLCSLCDAVLPQLPPALTSLVQSQMLSLTLFVWLCLSISQQSMLQPCWPVAQLTATAEQAKVRSEVRALGAKGPIKPNQDPKPLSFEGERSLHASYASPSRALHT